MARPKASTAAESVESEGPSEPEQPVESDERVDLDEDNDPEETMEEEVEYEEVEVEEEEEEEIEEEVEEEVEEEDQDVENANGAGADETKLEDGDEKRKHAELLARPPHGSEVYIGGISHDVSQEDLKDFCESVGEVTEVLSFAICEELFFFFFFLEIKTDTSYFMMAGSDYER